MPSSYTSSLRFTLQATGENLNTWGNILNSGCFQLIDTAISGRVAFSTSGTKTLTSNQGASDEARNAIIDVTGGTGVTITAPSVSKIYLVRNNSSGDVIVTTGGSTNATVKAGERWPVYTDGTNYYRYRLLDMQGDRLSNLATPTLANDAVTKTYADLIRSDLITYVNNTAFASTNLPGITSSTAGQFVGNNGTAADWYWDGYQGRSTKSADYTIALTDRQKLIAATAALNFTMTAATTLTSYFTARIANEAATAYVTITASGSDTINGASSITLAPGDVVDITGDGTSAFIAKYVVQQAQGPHVIVQDQKSSGTGGGTSAATSYQTRTLNTIVRNTVGASLSSNEVTLPAGTWRLEAWAAGYLVNQHRVRIYNVTDAATAILGSSSYSTSGAAVTTFALADGVVTITASKAFRVEHYTNNASASGLGFPVSTGEVEIYTEFRATRISG